jgi:hypothetical protein
MPEACEITNGMRCLEALVALLESTAPLGIFSTHPLPHDDDDRIHSRYPSHQPPLLPFSLSLSLSLSLLPSLTSASPNFVEARITATAFLHGRNRQSGISGFLVATLDEDEQGPTTAFFSSGPGTRTPGPWFISVPSRRQEARWQAALQAIQPPVARQFWHCVDIHEGGTGGRKSHKSHMKLALTLLTRVWSSPYPSWCCKATPSNCCRRPSRRARHTSA